jgi:probable phosphoglycerate mutase
MNYRLQFDGCCKGNPGIGGAGAVLYENDQEIWSHSEWVGDKTTNNIAEYHGLLLGLKESIQRGIDCLTVQGDSLLIIRQMKGEYK